MENSILNKVRELLGMEIKLEQRKLDDSTTTVEAESFEKGDDIMIVTEDEQKIALPVGEYKMQSGEILIVKEEGKIDEIKAEEKEEEEKIEEDSKKHKDEEMYEEEVEASTEDVKPVKKTVESIVKETFFSEMEALKKENEELKAEIELLSKEEIKKEEEAETEVKEETVAEVSEEVELSEDKKPEEVEAAADPITHNPENKKTVEHIQYSSNRAKTTLDRVMEKLSK